MLLLLFEIVVLLLIFNDVTYQLEESQLLRLVIYESLSQIMTLNFCSTIVFAFLHIIGFLKCRHNTKNVNFQNKGLKIENRIAHPEWSRTKLII